MRNNILLVAGLLLLIFAVVLWNWNNTQHNVAPTNTSLTSSALMPCHVVRSAGSIYGPQLVGNCKNAFPSYVASFNGTATIPDYIYVDRFGAINNSFTLSWWMYPTRIGNGVTGAYPWSEDIVDIYNSTEYPQIYVEWRGDSSFNLNMCNGFYYNGTVDCRESWIYLNNSMRWIQVAITYDIGNYTFYVDGKKIRKVYGGAGLPSITISNPKVYLSYLVPYSTNAVDTVFGGYMSNVQIYNVSLTPSNITLLYSEGISGAPVDLGSIIGWWKLDGNANDYGGNNYTGKLINGVTFATYENLS